MRHSADFTGWSPVYSLEHPALAWCHWFLQRSVLKRPIFHINRRSRAIGGWIPTETVRSVTVDIYPSNNRGRGAPCSCLTDTLYDCDGECVHRVLEVSQVWLS